MSIPSELDRFEVFLDCHRTSLADLEFFDKHMHVRNQCLGIFVRFEVFFGSFVGRRLNNLECVAADLECRITADVGIG